MAEVLSASLFAILTALIEERAGLHYDGRELELFSNKLRARAVDAGFESPLDYYYFLRYDDAGGREFDALVEALVVHETYFFREVEPLRVVVDQIVAPRVAAGRRPRIWCAACSTGEEPLTVAMLLEERGLLGQVEIVGSDISAKALARAREGVYGGRALRALAPLARARWFEEDGERVRVRAAIRAAVSFHRVNLLDTVAVGALGTFDAILCRNALIYFHDTTVGAVSLRLAERLEVDGYLLVGASESLMRFGTFLKCEERGGAFLYSKAAT